jgi:DNA-binding transcriptional ArsR family regulator
MDDPQELQKVAACLEALGNETRLAIYRLLVKAGPDGLAVGAVQEALRVPASTLTHHLGRLVWVGLVRQQRHGRRLICSANFEGLNKMMAFMQRECCEGAADAGSADQHAARG